MGSFQQRLVELMAAKGVPNAPKLAKALGYSGSERVRLVLNGTSKPSFGMLEDLARVFASLNLHWLITGEGEMWLPATPPVSHIPAVDAILATNAHIQAVAGPPEWQKALMDLQARLAAVERAQKEVVRPIKNKKAG